MTDHPPHKNGAAPETEAAAKAAKEAAAAAAAAAVGPFIITQWLKSSVSRREEDDGEMLCSCSCSVRGR